LTSSPTIDWGLARSVARRCTPNGPEVSAHEARSVVAELREHADQAREHVYDITGLVAAPGHPAVVVDRPQWIDSNLSALDTIMDLWPAANDRHENASAATQVIGPRAIAVQLGTALGWLSGKILGQYEALADPGRLLLVAPSIVDIERSLELDSSDFRLWVCLHEETHRVQFGAVPWLTEHFRGLITRTLDTFDEATPTDRLSALLAELISAIGQRRTPDLMTALQTPEQRAIVDEMTGLMSLLEGHADVVMDEAGPAVVPSVAAIRRRFEGRRSSQSSARGADAIWRKALRMDAKLRQYHEGAVFVRALMDNGGMVSVNRVWDAPENLPSLDEIRRPDAWLERMRGLAA
jgi:coenzyme F420 biosynthesis associated uncharacterized protein